MSDLDPSIRAKIRRKAEAVKTAIGLIAVSDSLGEWRAVSNVEAVIALLDQLDASERMLRKTEAVITVVRDAARAALIDVGGPLRAGSRAHFQINRIETAIAMLAASRKTLPEESE